MRLVSLSFVLCVLFSVALHAGTTGNIRGVVRDAEKKEALGGVTVVATSTSLQGEIAALTDEAGLYTLTNLPAGTYTITAMFAGATSERTGVTVSVDRTVAINMDLSLASAGGEVYTITEKAPNIDVASSTVGVTVTKEYIENVPMGRDRNFDNAMSVLPTAGGDAYGTSVGGATSPENTYVVDGLNTTDPSTGLIGTRLVLEFIDQFDIKEGGYGPEFGRATGGFVNAVTKGGSNDFHGSVFAYYRPGFLQAKPKLVKRAADSLVRRSMLDYYLNVGFEVGGPIVADKLWFHVGYSPEFQSDQWIRELRPIVNDGTNNPKRDDNGDFVMTEPALPLDQYGSFAQSHQYTLKLTHLIDNNNRHSLGVRGSPTIFDGAVGNSFDPDSPSRSMNGGPETFHYKQTSGNFISGVYNFAGKYFNDKFKVDAYGGVHYQSSKYEGSWPGTTDKDAYMTYMYGDIGLDDLWEPNRWNPAVKLPDVCTGRFADGTPRCPVRNYSRFGFGSVSDSSLIRVAEKVMFTNLAEFAGLHQLKYGIDFEQLRSNLTHGNTGPTGAKGSFSDYKDAGDFKSQQYAVKKRGEPTAVVDQIPSIAQTLNWGAFIGDSWNPTPNLILNFGVRWEGQDFFGVLTPETEMSKLQLAHKFAVLDNWAPRAGAVWDFLGNGKGVVRFNYGRFFEAIPMDINERAFGGEGQQIRFWDRTKCKANKGDAGYLNPNDATDLAKIKNPMNQCEPFKNGARDRVLGGEDSIVAPGMRGQFSDEFVLSADVEPFPSWVFGIAGIYRYMGRVIEDMSVDGGETYMFSNPGDYDINSLEGIRQRMLREKDPEARSRLQKTYNLLPRVNEFPKPVRDIWQVQFRVDKKISDHFMLLATYVVSWASGNYPGLFSANNGQLDPNLTSQFDLPQLLVNRTGYLPQDRRHRIKLSGFYKAALKDFGIDSGWFFDVGASGRVQSGSPYEALGADDIYGSNEIFMLPRGAGGRTPWTWSLDLNLGAGYNITDTVTAELFAALYNVTNNQDPVAFDDAYTYDTVKPIVGGNFSQLAHARNVENRPVKVNPNYGNAVAFQAPFSAQLGFRLKF